MGQLLVELTFRLRRTAVGVDIFGLHEQASALRSMAVDEQNRPIRRPQNDLIDIWLDSTFVLKMIAALVCSRAFETVSPDTQRLNWETRVASEFSRLITESRSSMRVLGGQHASILSFL